MMQFGFYFFEQKNRTHLDMWLYVVGAHERMNARSYHQCQSTQLSPVVSAGVGYDMGSCVNIALIN